MVKFISKISIIGPPIPVSTNNNRQNYDGIIVMMIDDWWWWLMMMIDDDDDDDEPASINPGILVSNMMIPTIIRMIIEICIVRLSILLLSNNPLR